MTLGEDSGAPPLVEGATRAGRYVYASKQRGYVDVYEVGQKTRVDEAFDLLGNGTSATRADLFEIIYRTNAWCSTGSRSGPGSDSRHGGSAMEQLRALLVRHEIRSMLDVPCGDLSWIAELSLAEIRYTGVDIVPEIIERNRSQFGPTGRSFLASDLTVDRLPSADLVLCRDGIVHLSDADAVNALRNISRSGSRYLLATHFPATPVNLDIATGRWRPVNMCLAPFNLPPPVEEIADVDFFPASGKTLGLWKLGNP
jgi:hypothetical protein